MLLHRWGLSSVLTGSSLSDAVVGLLVNRTACGARMGKSQSFGQSTHGVDIRASEDSVQRRVLLDFPTAGDVMKRMDSFFMNHAYGAFSLNILSELAVKLLFLICTSLALLFCWKAKKRENFSIEQQFERRLDDHFEKQNQYLRSDSFGRFLRRQLAQNSLGPGPSVPGSQAQANSSGEQLSSIPIVEGSNAEISLARVQLVNLKNVLPTKCENVVGVEQEGLRKRPNRPNGFIKDFHIPDGSRSLELASTSSNARDSRTVPTQAQKVETGGDAVIDIPAICFFPTSASMEVGNKFKQIMKDKVGVSSEQDVSSSRIIQARVRATDENLSALRDVAIDGMKLDKGFTLQIGGSFLYYCNGNPQEPVLLSLRDDEVPIILQADYSAGVLTIRGRYLEGAEIRAATFDGYMILNTTKQDEINNDSPPPERKVEVWRCTDLLPPVNLDQIQICASKTVCIEEKDVTVRSEVLPIQNTSLRTVIRNWVPTAILIVVMAIQVWTLLSTLLNLMTDPLHRTWLSYALLVLAVCIIHLLPPSLEDKIKAFVERFKLAISSFHVLPDLLGSPAFIMRNGYCFQRGAKHLVDCDLLIGPKHRGSSETEKQGCQKKEKTETDTQGSCEPEKDLNREEDPTKTTLHSEIEESSPSSRDWKWPCFREIYDSKKRSYVLEKFNSDTKQEQELHQVSDPFTVTYMRPKIDWERRNINISVEYIPSKNVIVKLYSKHLQEVIRNLLPSSLKLFPKYEEIPADDLFVLLIKKVLEKEANIHEEPNDPFASIDGSEGECLDVFHLVRFLKKEYGDTITHYERMVGKNVISWDMLWTLFAPQAEVIYYCDVSKEELLGKVLSVDYQFPSHNEEYKFRIDLGVYDYNCINFEVMKISRKILHFKGEVNINDMEVYPLEHNADPQKAEGVFLMRGRKFHDLVMKDEHRFMQYQGLVFLSPSMGSISIFNRPFELTRQFSNKENSYKENSYKENADGRVMLDQRSFAKINADSDMGTAQPSRMWRQGIRLKTKDALIDESNVLLKYSPAIAFGYSFAAKKWGCFTIDGFSEIQFISTAFDTLVMNEDIKNTLLTLTRYHVKHQEGTKDAVTNVDPLPHKGKGCIILLYGPSGTGKTLTVESVAEKLECPLWQLSVDYKSSRSTEQLETELLKIFEIAASWRAILLLDEADVYLSTRKYSPISSGVTKTNALTGIFLRILEYSTGVLFLTTNVIDSIESAIFSRMALFVKYEEFSIEDRQRLWINFFTCIGFPHPSQVFWDAVLPTKFNGRVIRNIVRNAQILAESEGVSLAEKHLLKAFKVMAAPSAMIRVIESEEKPDPKETYSTMSTFVPSSVTTAWPES